MFNTPLERFDLRATASRRSVSLVATDASLLVLHAKSVSSGVILDHGFCSRKGDTKTGTALHTIYPPVLHFPHLLPFFTHHFFLGNIGIDFASAVRSARTRNGFFLGLLYCTIHGTRSGFTAQSMNDRVLDKRREGKPLCVSLDRILAVLFFPMQTGGDVITICILDNELFTFLRSGEQ